MNLRVLAQNVKKQHQRIRSEFVSDQGKSSTLKDN